MKVFIIGGTGFIGRHVVAEFVNAGHEVLIFHRGKTPLARFKAVREIVGKRSSLEESAIRFVPLLLMSPST